MCNCGMGTNGKDPFKKSLRRLSTEEVSSNRKHEILCGRSLLTEGQHVGWQTTDIKMPDIRQIA